MAAVGGAAAEDVRGVALGVATLMFLVGGGVGSAVVGGVGSALGMAPSLLVLAAMPFLGLVAMTLDVRRTRRMATGPDELTASAGSS